MRPILGVLLALAVCAAFASAQKAPPAPTSDEALYEQLSAGGASATRALNSVLKKPQSTSAILLYTASGVALSAKRLEDAAFLFYIAQLRGRFDTDAFPHKGSGGDSPAVALGAMSSVVGQGVNPAIMGQPAVFKRVLARVEAWEPQISSGYSPGWEYTARVTTSAPRAAHAARKKETVAGMRGMVTLLNDPEYFKNFRLVQRYNGVAPGPPPSEAEYTAAIAQLKAIEQKKNIRGPMTASE